MIIMLTLLDPQNETCNEFIERMVTKYYKNHTSSTGFTLKISGIAEFIDGDFPLIDSPYIQECTSQTPKKLPQFLLVPLD